MRLKWRLWRSSGLARVVCLGCVCLQGWQGARAQSKGAESALDFVEGAADSTGRAGARVESAAAPVIVIGFVGGFVGHDNTVHSPVQLAGRLRKEYPAGVYVEVFENRRREDAHRKILELLGMSGGRQGQTAKTAEARHDRTESGTESGGRVPEQAGTNSAQASKEGDGAITGSEKQRARIIIYGMSWGGSESVALARELKEQKIPVLLTIQVDSVRKLGEDDGVIPANVAEAANFYQVDGLLHGRQEIRAEDAGKTRIIGNFRYEYKRQSLACEGYPWWDRVLTKYHTEIECDPAVWSQVEELIRAKLPATSH